MFDNMSPEVRTLSELLGALEPLRTREWSDISQLRSSVHSVTKPYRRTLECYGPLIIDDVSVLEIRTRDGEVHPVTFRVPRQRTTW